MAGRGPTSRTGDKCDVGGSEGPHRGGAAGDQGPVSGAVGEGGGVRWGFAGKTKVAVSYVRRLSGFGRGAFLRFVGKEGGI